MAESFSGSMHRERSGYWTANCDLDGCGATATNLHDTDECMEWLRLHWWLWRDRPDLHAQVQAKTVAPDV